MNKKGFTGVGLIIFAVIVAGVLGYFVLTNKQSNLSGEVPPDWQLIDAETFTLSLPSGWKFNKLQGIDSYVGEFVGDGATLRFDYGWYSQAPEIAYKNNISQVVSKEFINDYKAEIVLPAPAKDASDCRSDSDCSSETWPCEKNLGKCLGRRTTGIYFGGLESNGRNSLWLFGDNLTQSQHETALKIFRTIQIARAPGSGTVNVGDPNKDGLATYPDLSLNAPLTGSVSVKFIIEHRSALHGKTILVKGIVIDSLLGEKACPPGIGGCAQPRIFLADSSDSRRDKNYDLMILVGEEDTERDYEIGKNYELLINFEASKVAAVGRKAVVVP